MIRLTQKQKEFVCDHIARFAPRAEVISACVEEFGLADTAEVRAELYRKIDYFKGHPSAARWHRYIEQRRAAWLADMDDVPLANRKIRLLELARFYEACLDRLETCEAATDMDKAIVTALKVLREIREEAEQIASKLAEDDAAEAVNEFEQMTDEELVTAAKAAGIQVPDVLLTAMG